MIRKPVRRSAVFAGATLSLLALSAACTSTQYRKLASDKEDPVAPNAPVIRSDYKPGEVTQLCDVALDQVKKGLDEVGRLPVETRDIEKTLLAFEQANMDFSDAITPLTFMKYVSTDEKINKEGAECEDKAAQFSVDEWTRRDLYRVIKDQVPRSGAERRLLSETVRLFEKSGLKLSDEKLAQVKALQSKLVTLQNQFQTNLNNDQTKVTFTAAEMEGAPERFLASLKKDDQGNYIVTTSEPDYVQFTQTVKSSEARRKMTLAYYNRAGEKNPPLLTQAIEIRRQIAALMGMPTWADYQTQGRMADSAKTVWTFLNDVRDKLKKGNQADLAKLLAFKKQLEPTATDVKVWDVNYLSYQLQKRDFAFDPEEARKYFPADTVIQGMFNVYSKLLGVKFREVPDAKVWAKSVKQYEISDATSGEVLAYFYADWYPRPLKYNHAAAFPLIQGRQKGDHYSKPVAAIVANVTAPVNGKPSLLSHDDVETIFHEFGHIMHGTLTRAPYGSLSGTAVPQDFVEAPSQMLENWVWNSEILSQISGNYENPSQKLPEELLKKMLAARDFQQAYKYTRQAMLASIDMTYHTAPKIDDVNAVYDRAVRDYQGLAPLEGGHWVAGFGHLMGGYDAGYYGYLWSKVYAEDMFTRFEKAGLTNTEVGLQYRRAVLEKGNMAPSMDLLRDFLGREPNSDAFFRRLGIQPTHAKLKHSKNRAVANRKAKAH